MWNDQRLCCYMIKGALSSESELKMVWLSIDIYIINRTLHGHLEIRNLSSGAEKYFTRSQSVTREKNVFLLNIRGEIHYLHKSHNTVHLGGLFALKQWIFCSLKHDTVPRVNKLYCFYVKNLPKQIALWYCASCEFRIFARRCNHHGLRALCYERQWIMPYC